MNFDKYVQEANEFIHEVGRALDTSNDEQSLRITTAVLHALREIITPEESMHLISQLPMLLKAIYVNSWHMSRQKRIRTKAALIAFLISQNPRAFERDFREEQSALEIFKTVLMILKRRVSAGEIDDIVQQFPTDLADLWYSERAQV